MLPPSPTTTTSRCLKRHPIANPPLTPKSHPCPPPLPPVGVRLYIFSYHPQAPQRQQLRRRSKSNKLKKKTKTKRSSKKLPTARPHALQKSPLAKDHEFRPHVLPAVRVWFYATEPVNEVRYMATLGAPQKPGEIEGGSGMGNEEFNRGESYYVMPVVSSSGASFGGSTSSGSTMRSTNNSAGERNKFAHKLVQVYQLNNPVKKEELEEHGFGKGLPTKYRLLPPAAVGDLLANLRCALFDEEGDEENGEEDEEEGKLEAIEEGDEEEDEDEVMGKTAESQPDQGVTISQELEQQLRSDIIRSTQMMLSESDDARLPGEAGEALLRHESTIASSPQRPPKPTRERVTSSGSKKKKSRDSQPPRMTVTKVTKKKQVLVTTKKFQFAELEMEDDEDEDLDVDRGGMKTPPAALPPRSRPAATSASTSTSVSASTSKPNTARKASGSRSASSQTTQTQTQSQTETRQTRRQSQRLTGSQHQHETQSQPQVNKTTTAKALQEKASMPPPPSPAKPRGGSSSKITTSALAKFNKATTTSTTRASTSLFGTAFSVGGHNNPNYNTARPSQATTASGPSSPIIPTRPDEEEVQEASLPQLSHTGQGQGRGVGTGTGTGRGRGRGRGRRPQSQLQLHHSESLTASASASESSVIRPTVPDDGDDSYILLLSSSSIDVPEEGSFTPTAATNRAGRSQTQTPGSGRSRGLGRLPLSSSQAIASLAPDSLLVDVEGVRAPPELVVWDSEDEGREDEDEDRGRERDDDETASEDDGDLN
ncbi:hypothetical protein SMACR_00688 [Sordaria macrospora]|uniref:Uncharacterized protein n=1 Tax=Sordaria macrospora TaxID=5147 RepID=A0A8S8ZT44_SORMA|nr:hypothetical protein SMACR_00688 [Sordaria macrospora]